MASIVRGGRELLDVTDPLDAELWASQVLGTAYKRLPLDVEERFREAVFSGILDMAEAEGSKSSLAVLRALASVTPTMQSLAATSVADRMAAAGCGEPVWADMIGSPAFVSSWAMIDPFGDQTGYYAHFRYPGQPEHLIGAVYDENLGGIIKDAAAGSLLADPRKDAEGDPDLRAEDIDPGMLAARVRAAIASGDIFVDNYWTDDFRWLRALLLARMMLLPEVEWSEPEPPDEEARQVIIDAFLASPGAPDDDDVTRGVLDHCMTARCDYGDGDPYRWSPIVVEMFMLDFLPRKTILDTAQIRALPEVLKLWVRYSLAKRGLDEQRIADTLAAIERLAPEFRRAVTDPDNFGSAKALVNAMLADGVDLTDQAAVGSWIGAFNARPFEVRDEFLGERSPLDPPDDRNRD